MTKRDCIPYGDQFMGLWDMRVKEVRIEMTELVYLLAVMITIILRIVGDVAAILD